MSGLKSAWEISLEKSNNINPELKSKKSLTVKQKKKIEEIRKDYEARIADKKVMLDYKLNKLSDRVPPEQFPVESEKLKEQFASEKLSLEEEMDDKIKVVRL